MPGRGRLRSRGKRKLEKVGATAGPDSASVQSAENTSPLKESRITDFFKASGRHCGQSEVSRSIVSDSHEKENGLDYVIPNKEPKLDVSRSAIISRTDSPPRSDNITKITTPMATRTSHLNGVMSPSSTLSRLTLSPRYYTGQKPAVKPKARSRLQNKNNNRNNGKSDNHHMTEYFPVRRSERKCHTKLMKEKQKLIEETILSGREDGFQVACLEDKGRGVFAKRLFRKGEFVLEYSGELIHITEAKRREFIYAQDQNTGCYMYYFTCRNTNYCIDATAESGRLGRLVNHSRQDNNLVTKAFLIDDKPHLILVARRDIEAGEELLYDYGDRSKTSITFHPWLST